ncbi:MAG TPA: WD40 repeat domain-containing protein [Gemmataceae bacterium]|nr:WD40 repeat domain-containing protein [Gemmataceae bacterium]
MPGIPRDHHATLSPDGHKVVFAVEENKSNTIRVAATATGHELYRIAMVDNFCYHALFSPDGKWLATAEGEVTRVFRADSGAPYAKFLECPGSFGGLRLGFSPDSKLLASCSGHGLVYIYEVDSRRLIHKLELSPVSAQVGGAGWVCSAAFSPDGERLVTCSEDGGVRIFRLSSGACELDLAGSPGTTYTAVFSPDGSNVATSGDDGAVMIWDSATGHRRLTLSGHDRDHPVYTCNYTADGTRLLTASVDGSVRLWDTESGQELLTLHPFDGLGRASIQTAAISSDGGRIVVNSRGLVRIIDVPTGDPAVGLSPAHVVYGLFRKSQSRAEVVARLMADPTLPEAVRTAAIRLAETYPLKVVEEDHESMNEILPPAEATPAQLETALARAEQNLRDRPTDFMGQLIRGVAQFRCGAIEKATLTLESMEWPLDRGLPGPEEGIRLAFLAASFRRQGKENEAAEVFSDLARGLKVHPFWDECAEFKKAYQEAKNSIAPMPKKP